MSFEKRNILDVVLIPLGLIAFIALGWWAVYAGPDSADKIEARRSLNVEQALTPYSWVSFEISGQNVTLTGTAPTQENRTRAVRAARQASGRGGLWWGGIKHVVDQTEIAPAIETYVFTAIKTGGSIYLSGYLPDEDARYRLTERVNREGFWGEEVIDETRFAEGMPDGDWVGAADLGLSQLVRMTNARMDLTDKRIFLKGEAPNAAVKLQITRRMTRPPSGYTADVDLSGSAIWSARIEHDRLSLSGAVPDAAVRTALADLAQRFFDGEIVNSQIIRPMEAGDWVSGVETALPNFLQFRNGEMAFMGNDLIIDGEASQSVIDFLREDMVRSGVPVEFQLRAKPISTDLKVLSGLPDGETAEPAICRLALAEALGAGRILFRYGDDAPKRESGVVLDGIEAVLRACPDEVLFISAYTHVNGRRIAGHQLTKARQQAISDYFIARGVPLNQIELTSLEAGESAPDIDNSGLEPSQIRLHFEE